MTTVCPSCGIPSESSLHAHFCGGRREPELEYAKNGTTTQLKEVNKMNDDLWTDALELTRELRKAEEALAACDRHFQAAAESNAALHMSDRVIPNPLASHVALTLSNLRHVLYGTDQSGESL